MINQEEVQSSLFQQIVKLMDLLCTKYMKAVITDEGIQRIGILHPLREALREALLNACINKEYKQFTHTNSYVQEQTEDYRCRHIARWLDCGYIVLFTRKAALHS